MKKTLVVGAVLIMFIIGLNGAEPASALEGLDEILAQSLETFGVPSMAVGVIRDGAVVFNRAFGMHNLRTRAVATPDTIYRIGSCSKAFAAAALGVLVDRGLIRWTDRVRDHLPEFRLHDPYVSTHATIEDLLTHRMGFKSFDGDLLWYRTEYDAREILDRISRLPLAHEFRTTKGYSNVMYMVVQQLVERLSGVEYADFVKQNIFDPTGMNHANLRFDQVKSKNEFAHPYKKRKELEAEPLYALLAAGGVNASMNDMLKWTAMLLAGGMAGDTRVLSQSAVDSFFSPRMINPLGGLEQYQDLKFYLYGLGWNLYPYHDVKVVVHQGALPGYIANVLLVPEKKLGVVVMCNELTMLSFGVSRKILDLILGVRGKEWIADALRFDQWMAEQEKAKEQELTASVKPGTRPSLRLEEYCGRYRDPYYGDATISLQNGKLYLSLDPTSGRLSSILDPHHRDSFRVDFQDPYIPTGLVVFRLEEKSKIAGFTFLIQSTDFNFENLNFFKTACP